jgi:hypothetical protein
MKRIFNFGILVLMFGLSVRAQTSGTLSVSVNTSTAGGNYSPSNVIAIWVEDASGKFVKTLLAFASKRRTHLNAWESTTNLAGSVYNTVDAVTGATQNSHGLRVCTWKGKNFSGNIVADGNYILRMELTDKNSSGNMATVNFIKGITSQLINPPNAPGFSSISLRWDPNLIAVKKMKSDAGDFLVYPNPGSGYFKVTGNKISYLTVSDLTGKVILTSLTSEIDLSHEPSGIYFLTIKTETESVVKKLIKQ